MTRHLYRLLLRLHPEAFRKRFSEEMLAIFDQMREGRLWLLADAAASLGRQWMLRERAGPAAPGPGPELALTAVDVPGPFTGLILRGLVPALVLCAALTAALRQPKVASFLDPYFDKARTIVQAPQSEPSAEASAESKPRPRPLRADDITHALIQQFRRYDVVALGEWHSTKEDSDVRINLIRAPAFAASVRNIVFECASSLHQNTLDRFIAGVDVPLEQLRSVWRDVLTPGACDSPVYEEFLRQVRDTNRHLDPASRIRVLAAGPPVDWTRVASAADVAPFAAQTDSLPARLVAEILARGQERKGPGAGRQGSAEHEVSLPAPRLRFARVPQELGQAGAASKEVGNSSEAGSPGSLPGRVHQKALIVFGAAHLWRQTRGVVIPDDSTLIGQLDRGYPGRTYTVLRIDGAKVGFVPLQSSDLGRLPANAYLGKGMPFALFPDAVTLAQVADAIIVTGPHAGTVVPAPAPEPEWEAEMARRHALRRR